MKSFRFIDNLVGWCTFAIAAFVYCSTIEPTASFWDCPEFITTGYKLEIGHPPGAPFFMLTANLFSQFTSDPTQVARMVNIMSALFSAACILFLFWSISHLVRKLISAPNETLTASKILTIEGSALIGALVYTFSDTFWFSAVEGEVYAYSSLFTAIVFWLILKWEEHADEPHSDRWLVLIAYLTGLSIGVHLLNLLCLPAIVLVYYYRKCPNADLKGSLLALCGSMALVAAVLYGIVPGIVKMGGWFELLFVNGLGMSFNSGLYIYLILLVTAVIAAIWATQTGKSRKLSGILYLIAVALLGIPFYGHGFSSLIIGIIVLGFIGFFIFRARDNKPLISARALNTSLLCMLMIMIGYSSYAVIVIRSTANPPMDQNSPEDIFTLGSYLNREQYGSHPLFYGETFASDIKREIRGNYITPVIEEGAPVYVRAEKTSADEKDRYEVARHELKVEYMQNMLFPRMHSSMPQHVQGYKAWMGSRYKGHKVRYTNYGEALEVTVPTQWENFIFFTSYQINYMYWRYFMWNFAGRQNDIQGTNGEPEHGNWLSGIPFIDNLRLGDQDKLPDELKENKGHNVYYCLPLLLGLLGFFWQALRGNEGAKQFWVVFFLFFMTGLAIVLYLNQTPGQPRERDYAYAGSFYAFAIWVGLGVTALIEWLKKTRLSEGYAALIVLFLTLPVPALMAAQNWDDHDRSNRYTCRDFGQNYLQSLPEGSNPIIFTNGDNDTFPLWYNQETEGVRTDARVCNLSYLNTDWYIDQMKRPAYDSPAVPISMERWQYIEGKNESTTIRPGVLEYYMESFKDHPEELKEAFGNNPYDLKNILKYWVESDTPEMRFIPTDSLVLTIDKEAVRRSGMMMAGDSIPDVMPISLAESGGRLSKSDLMMLEMLAHCNWERPLYIASTVGESYYIRSLSNNLVQEGLNYRITPFNTTESGKDFDVERTYDVVMNKFKFGGVDTPGIYLDETVMRMCYTHRRLFANLAKELILAGDTVRARKVLEKAEEVLPPYSVPYTYQSGAIELATSWMQLNEDEKALTLITPVMETAGQYINWYLSLGRTRAKAAQREIGYYFYQLSDIHRLLRYIGPEEENTCTVLMENLYNAALQQGIQLQL